jgi:hypothetical protein
MRKLHVVFTTRDSCDTPRKPNGDWTYSDDICAMIEDVVRSALKDWYDTVGEPYLRCEPDVV